MVIPILFGIALGEKAVMSLVYTMLLSVGCGAALFMPNYRTTEEVLRKEGYFIVTFAWAGAALLGGLPYIFSGALSHPVDAYFEAISGFTTTGSTVIADLYQVPKCILMWRSETQWLGGMGIIVLLVALFSFFGVGGGGKSIFHSEAPGVYRTGIRPKIQDTAQKLWIIYVVITAIEVVLLIAGGMTFYEALLHSFSTMATGGFSSHNASVGYYESAYIEWVITIFMLLAGMNFGLYYGLLMTRKLKTFSRDYEWRVYMYSVAAAIAATAVFLVKDHYYGPLESIRHAAFQVVSMITTTGFCTRDFDQWPQFVRLLFIVIMFLGGCTGSTGGGIKVFRVAVVFKHISAELYRMIHPSAVLTVRAGNSRVEPEVVSQTMGFFGLAIMVFTALSLIVTCFGIDIVTSFSAVAATLWNIGPGLEKVGAIQNFAWMPPAVKVVLSFAMLAGRLELFTVFVLFSPKFWKS